MGNFVYGDVLVIGGGGAAGRAAIEAADQGAEVILVDKKTFGRSGSSGIHPGLLLASSIADGDTIDTHVKDTLKGGDFLGNPKLVRILAEGTRKAVIELERYGNIFERDDKGKLIPYQMGGHSVPRSFSPAFMWTIANEVRRRGVRIFGETMITSILTHKGRAVGATGVSLESGAFYVFRAKSTILGTGGIGQLYGWSTVAARTTNPVEVTGDGQAMAYRAGAELVDMEFVQFLVFMVHPSQFAGAFIGADASMKDYIFDKNGVHWMKDVPMKEMTRARLVKEIILRIKKGKGTPHGGVWVDCSSVLDYMATECLLAPKIGIDLSKDRVGIAPSCHHLMGGVVIDETCQSTVPGLYACGEVAGGIHGSNRLGSNAHADIIVFGKIAGEHAAIRARKIEKPEIDWNQVEKEQTRVYDILDRNPNEPIRVHIVRQRLQRLMWNKASPLRTQKTLQEALVELKKIRIDLPKIYVSSKTRIYNNEWIEALETYNMTDVGEVILKAAIMREESRGAHQRVDYPEIDDVNWKANIYLKQVKGEIMLEKRPISQQKRSSSRKERS